MHVGPSNKWWTVGLRTTCSSVRTQLRCCVPLCDNSVDAAFDQRCFIKRDRLASETGIHATTLPSPRLSFVEVRHVNDIGNTPLATRLVPLVAARLAAPANASTVISVLHKFPLPRSLAHLKRVRSSTAVAPPQPLAHAHGSDLNLSLPRGGDQASLSIDVLVATVDVFAAWFEAARSLDIPSLDPDLETRIELVAHCGGRGAYNAAARGLSATCTGNDPQVAVQSATMSVGPLIDLAALVTSYSVVHVPGIPPSDLSTLATESAAVWPMSRPPPGRRGVAVLSIGAAAYIAPPAPQLTELEVDYFSAALALVDALAAHGAARGHPRRACVIAEPPARMLPVSVGGPLGASASSPSVRRHFLVRGAAWDKSAVHDVSITRDSRSAMVSTLWRALHPLHTSTMLAIDDVADADRRKDASAAMNAGVTATLAAALAEDADSRSDSSPRKRRRVGSLCNGDALPATECDNELGFLGRAWIACTAGSMHVPAYGCLPEVQRHNTTGDDAAVRSYLCTGLDAFLLQEPSTLDAMALLHSRVARVVYRCADPLNGALGSAPLALHELPGINHRYRVYVAHHSAHAPIDISTDS